MKLRLELRTLVALCVTASVATCRAQSSRVQANHRAWQSFNAGIVLLQKGAPRTEVLAQWEATLKNYPNSEYRRQLLSYVTVLRQQVSQDKAFPSTELQEPERLPLTQRIAYYISRFPDVHGEQWGQPGTCSVLGNREGTRCSDAIFKIGRRAVPALIQRLDDRRLTRSVGFWRNFGPHRTVLRVQDVALQCLEAILGMRFLPPDLTYLSIAQPPLHDEVTADIKSWWKENGQKMPLQGYLARLQRLEKAKAPVWQRVEMLEKIEGLDKKPVNPTALLRHWAAEMKDDRDYLPVIAKKLAQRGDTSWIPAMRRILRDNQESESEEVIWCVLKFGNADDYRLLSQRVRRDVRAGKSLGTSAYLAPAITGLAGTNRALAAPLLVEIVQHRQSTGGHSVAGGGYVAEFRSHDRSMLDLIRLTGHNEGFDAHASQDARFAAIERWLAWWNQQGKAAYIRKHPELG